MTPTPTTSPATDAAAAIEAKRKSDNGEAVKDAIWRAAQRLFEAGYGRGSANVPQMARMIDVEVTPVAVELLRGLARTRTERAVLATRCRELDEENVRLRERVVELEGTAMPGIRYPGEGDKYQPPPLVGRLPDGSVAATGTERTGR